MDWDIKWVKGPNNKILVDQNGNPIWDMWYQVSYYFNVNFRGWVFNGPSKKEGK